MPNGTAAYNRDSVAYETTEEEQISTQVYLVQSEKERSIYLFVKRFCDLVLSALALVLLSPAFLVIAVIIRMDSHGPAFFAHNRIGKNHKPIKIYKFRTMVDHAEEMIQDFTPEQQKEFKQNFKMENDPRITRTGKFLRKTSLDELPQLLNILNGTLSIVGPRPVVEKELEKYGENVGNFLSVKPGLTGYWQVHGRSNTTYEQRVEMDLHYIEKRSLWMDLVIILGTVPAVLAKRGAY